MLEECEGRDLLIFLQKAYVMKTSRNRLLFFIVHLFWQTEISVKYLGIYKVCSTSLPLDHASLLKRSGPKRVANYFFKIAYEHLC